MVDYSLLPIIQKLSVGELNVYSASTLRKLEREYVRNYASLLRTELDSKMFVGLPRSRREKIDYTKWSPIFDGFAYRSEGDWGIYFCGNKEVLQDRKTGRWYMSDRSEIKTVEDLIPLDLVFNENGINLVKTRP